MSSDRDMPDASPVVREEHEDEQEAIGRRRDHEKIGRHDLADVIPQERAPRLRWRLTPVAHVFCDCRLTDVDPQFQQFAMNPRRAPTRVRLRYRANQRPDVGGHGRSPDTAPAFPHPPQPEAPSVPGDDGLRLDDHQRRSPPNPDAGDHGPKAPVYLGEPQASPSGALQHLELVP
jgi:hypothetical protein